MPTASQDVLEVESYFQMPGITDVNLAHFARKWILLIVRRELMRTGSLTPACASGIQGYHIVRSFAVSLLASY